MNGRDFDEALVYELLSVYARLGAYIAPRAHQRPFSGQAIRGLMTTTAFLGPDPGGLAM
jgi:hypothetical protein